ncbi:hypothetical protein SAMN05428989_0851 [Pseudoxanthomonas sp. GM95]|uniref:DUF6491 family protein n=1 Tax=Pseudoxanthomonas sp. GM95 TaxID=1881043 RepID=UPI0008B068DA|nr:DUF6491 family protein [Pseudoxanthomonas sp. GM95]SEK81299.1 hypothetical protein SAMN05428989_0851 [Pseudoxanthomonas sp. GM95]
MLHMFSRPALAGTLAIALLSGCATGTGLNDAQRLALYREHAGEPQRDFSYARQLTGWTALGDDGLAVWTKPNEAYLLEFGGGGCRDLDAASTILITNLLGQVSAGLDRVQVLNRPSGFNVACRIQTIRKLDTKALRASEKALREARVAERDAVPAAD